MMTGQEYLEQVSQQDRKVKLMRKELDMLREALDITAVRYDSIGAAPGTRPTDAMGEAICKMVDFERELKAEEVKLAVLRIEAGNAINNLENNSQREVLKRWYLLFQPISKIMAEMGYSKRRVYELRKNGLLLIVVPESPH